MRKQLNLSIFIILFLSFQTLFSQEWKSLKEYKKNTGEAVLQNGCWLKKDRIKNTLVWQQANKFNLTIKNGHLKYKSITQIGAFYLWFDKERKIIGHEINSFGVAAIVANQLSNFDNFFIRTFIVRNKEVIWFGNEGSKKVLEFAFPLMQELYFSDEILVGEKAKDWDIKNGKIEQCKIVEPIYNQLSAKAIKKLERMAKGKGIYYFGVKKALKYEGDIRDCKARYEHAFTKIFNFYLNKS